jgi:tRNA pseudouridine55 synthase
MRENDQAGVRSKNQTAFPGDGVFIIDKPVDWTSHDVVARVRKILKTRRVGHTGTLDPFATGVLVICVNRATRLVQFLTGDDKEYIATMRLGLATDTGDLTGAPIAPAADASHITVEKVREAFGHFRGRVKQIPPMYSAKKIGGVKLYEMARRGEEIERAPIEVEIRELELLEPADNLLEGGAPPGARDFSFRVVCSSGAYIRALAEDIGKFLGVGAHLTRLRRTRVGPCGLDAAVTLERLAELAESKRLDQTMIPMADAVAMPALRLDEGERKRVSHGRSIRRSGDWANGALAKLCDEKKQLLAVAEYDSSESLWHPRVVLIDRSKG